MKRTVANVAVGMVAGAALVGVPTYAVAGQDDDPSGHRSEMGQMMSDPDLREGMKSMMSEMMSDPELRRQMRSMMSGAMKEMPMMQRDGMAMRDQ